MPVQVPYADDFAVLGRAVVAYQANQTTDRLAVVALAQRVLIERAHRRRRPSAMSAVRRTIDLILADTAVAQAYANAPGAGRVLGAVFPIYRKTGLLPQEPIA